MCLFNMDAIGLKWLKTDPGAIKVKSRKKREKEVRIRIGI